MICEPEVCVPECPQVFSDLLVYPLIAGGTKVQWEMLPGFKEPGPYLFQLQFSPTRVDNDIGSWTDVGIEYEDTYVLTDPSVRMYGKFPSAHYRVRVRTAIATHYSKPAPIAGWMPHADRQFARSIVREELFRLRKKAGAPGYLLKRRQGGELCDCLDEMEQTITNPDHLACFGTGFLGGYYQPIECTWVEFLIGDLKRNMLDAQRGTVQDDVEFARMVNIPQIFSKDIWVSKDTDIRYSIESFRTAVEIRGVPIVLQPVELRPLPFSHVIYKYEIANQQRL